MIVCVVEGCTKLVSRRGRCGAHYQSWRRSPDFFRAPPPPPYVPPADPVCPWCGPFPRSAGSNALPVCPTCGLDAGEHAYIDRILADSAGVYAEEHRAYQAERRAS